MAGPPLTAVVVGGGIGGLTAALSLLQAGLRVQVYEQAAELAEVGAGLQLSPNATRVLQHLGLGPALSRTAVLPEALESRHWQDGRLLGSYRVNGSPPQYGAPPQYGTPPPPQYGTPPPPYQGQPGYAAMPPLRRRKG